MAQIEQHIIAERATRLPHMAVLPPEARGTKVEAALHRDILADRLIKSLDGNPHVAFAYTMGSTAEGKENEYSDKDMGVVVRTDADLNYILQNAGRAYGSFGELVGHYRYNPYHSYVTYQGALGPMPLDIYYLTEEMHDLMRNPAAVTIVDHVGSAKVEPEQKNTMVREMILDGYAKLQAARVFYDKGEHHDVVHELDGLRSVQLFQLLKLVEGYNIPHVKAVKLPEFDPEIRELFVRTFGSPTKESAGDALQAAELLLARIIMDASATDTQIDLVQRAIREAREDVMLGVAGDKKHTAVGVHRAIVLSQLETEGRQASPLLSGVSGILDKMPQVGLATYERALDGTDKLLVMMRDDESLNVLVDSAQTILEKEFPGSVIEHLTPVHLRVADASGNSLDVFLTSSSLYHTSRKKDTLTLVDNRGISPVPKETVFETEPDFPEMTGERELVVKGVVRTFRLLSKINKSDFVTYTYIMDAIRQGQLVPLMMQAGMDPRTDPLFPLTYCRPTAEGVRESVQAAMTLFADAYLRIRDTYNLNDLDVYMQKAFDAVSSFTHFEDAEQN